MNKFIVTILVLFATANSSYSALIYSQGFENGTGSDLEFYGSTYAEYITAHNACTEVVTNDPHSGSYSFRGSISETGALDNITGEAGCTQPYNQAAQLYDYGNTDNFSILVEATTDTCYISWWHKIDPGELPNLLGDTHKMLYFYTETWESYVVIYLYDTNGFNFQINLNNSVVTFVEGISCPIDLDDGNWHHYTFYMVYGTGNTEDGTVSFSIDDTSIYFDDTSYTVYNTGERCYKISIPSNISANVTQVTTMGWQIDDIEIWDSIPDGEDTPAEISLGSGSGHSIGSGAAITIQ